MSSELTALTNKKERILGLAKRTALTLKSYTHRRSHVKSEMMETSVRNKKMKSLVFAFNGLTALVEKMKRLLNKYFALLVQLDAKINHIIDGYIERLS